MSVYQCNGLDTIIEIDCFDKDKDGQELIGKVTVTLRELTMKITKYYIINPKKVGNLGYKHSGILHVNSITPLAWVQQEGMSDSFRMGEEVL